MFEVGKKVVCIQTHSMGKVIKDKLYPVKEIRISPCQCKSVELDVGINHESKGSFYYCPTCSCVISEGDTWWFNSVLFRPLDYSFANEAIEKAFEQTFVV